ncbi:MAG: family NAD(P)-dependent oxidoreductase, partial [Nevskia sp.]|nr:family NAD(P)-dependent oxidoreductase [Nevskia sp.]
VNNAGIHLDLLSQWQQPRLTPDGHELHWRTNYLGTMHLTLRLLPLLRATGRSGGDARIVNVVSQLHSKGSNAGLFESLQPYNSWVAYGNSKLALVHASFELQRRHASTDRLQAYCLHPGAVFTNIADKGLSGNPLLERLRKTFAPVEAFFLLTPEEGAQTQVYCASAAELSGGHYYRACAIAKPSADSGNAGVSSRLFSDTQAWADKQ